MQKRAEKTREKILKSAIVLFSRKGFASASVDGIAAAAGANKQRIYSYFGSKKGLFETCLRSLFSEVEAFSESMLADAEREPEKLTEILFRGFWAVHEKHPAFRRMLAWANLERAADPDLLIGIREAENRRIRAVFDRAVETGVLRQADYRTYLLSVMSLAYFCHSNETTLRRTTGIPSPDVMTEELVRMFRKS